MTITANAKPTRKCKKCERHLGKESYSTRRWKRKISECKECFAPSQNVRLPQNKSKSSVSVPCDSDAIQAAPEIRSKKRKRMSTKGDGAAGASEEIIDKEEIKSMLKQRIESIPISEQKIIRIIWISKSISARDEKAVANKVVLNGCYGPIDEQQMGHIQKQIKSTQVSLFQAITIRAAYLKQKTMYRTASLRNLGSSVFNKYRVGHSVVDLSRRFDQPPMNVFRTILSEMKWSKNAIKKALRDPKQFGQRERKEFLAAESADIVSMVNQIDIQMNSEEFEDALSVWLKGMGIRFVRQKELEKEQKKAFGKSILTPDFLLLDQVLINGDRCHWIDCKAYYGANLRLSIKQTQKQMARYIDHWGSGAIVYLQGFSAAIKMKDCILLDARGALDRKVLSRLEKNHCEAINKVSKTIFS